MMPGASGEVDDRQPRPHRQRRVHRRRARRGGHRHRHLVPRTAVALLAAIRARHRQAGAPGADHAHAARSSCSVAPPSASRASRSTCTAARPRLMASRCETLPEDAAARRLGEDAMRGTVMYKPDQEFDDTAELDADRPAGAVLYFGHSSGPGDMAVLDQRSGVLFAGGLLDERRIPDVQDATSTAGRRRCRRCARCPSSTVVPGHGPAASSKLIDAVERYLAAAATRGARPAAIRHRAERSARRGGAARVRSAGTSTTRSTGAMPRSLFLRFEREQMFKQAAPGAERFMSQPSAHDSPPCRCAASPLLVLCAPAAHARAAAACPHAAPRRLVARMGEPARQAVPRRAPSTRTPGTVQIIAPLRAAYGASVPVKIVSKLPQKPELYVKRLYLLVDKNPSPVAAVLDLTHRGRPGRFRDPAARGRIQPRARRQRAVQRRAAHGFALREDLRRLLGAAQPRRAAPDRQDRAASCPAG